ncbi:hypothetical protein GBAR_LOCUS11919 [Geodia barretti]|uniref:Uncharacterized protein n=1 Tax=Geodia barretti TaxID=519541 RepID=A0AA35RZB9_GEOBA|nr:hypothetical protein GBAR_LOCUS11919 [Geodia barretti]
MALQVVRTLKGCSLFVSLTAQKFVCSLPKDAISLEYDDRVLLRFIPDNPDFIPALEANGEYVRDRATVHINDSDGKRC